MPGAIVGYLMSRTVNRVLSRFFKWFNRGFDFVTGLYGRVVGISLRLCVIVLLIYGGLIGLTYFGMTHIPTGFIPAQDQGYLFVNLQMPDASTTDRTQATLAKLSDIATKTPGIHDVVVVAGFSILSRSNSSARSVIRFGFSRQRRPLAIWLITVRRIVM